MPAHGEYCRLVRFERFHDLVIVRDRIYGLLIYLLNYVAFLKVGGALIRLDADHHNAVNAVRQIQLAR